MATVHFNPDRALRPMSHNSHANETFEIEPVAGRAWDWQVPWWMLATGALAVIELKAAPAVGVMILCLRFGFNDWRTAGWLCRTDPFPKRAKRSKYFFRIRSELQLRSHRLTNASSVIFRQCPSV